MRLDSQAIDHILLMVRYLSKQDMESLSNWMIRMLDHDPIYALWVASLADELVGIALIDLRTKTAEECAEAAKYLREIANR